MPAIAIDTPFNISLDFTIAPFWKRLLAYVIDVVILLIYRMAYYFALARYLPDDEGTRKLVDIFVLGLPVILYHFLMETFFSGQSIGKKALGIRVVNFTGNEASISQYLIRMLFRSYMLAPLATIIIISLFYDITKADMTIVIIVFMLTFMLASLGMFLYYILSKYGQRLGDMMANTLVIETRAEADIHKTIYLDIVQESYEVKYPEVMRLTDRDINGIRNLLDVKRITSESEAYMQRIATRIEDVLGIKSDQHAYDFLAQLLRDYNYLTSK